MNLGVIDLTNGHWDTAAQHFQAALTIEPKHSVARLKLGNEPNQAMLDSIVNSAIRETRPAPLAPPTSRSCPTRPCR